MFFTLVLKFVTYLPRVKVRTTFLRVEHVKIYVISFVALVQ